MNRLSFISRGWTDRGYYNLHKTFLISHISTNHLKPPDDLSKTARKIKFHLNQNSSCSLTCIYACMRTGKCHNELLVTHKFSALKYSYSDEIFLLPARRIPIRIAFIRIAS